MIHCTEQRNIFNIQSIIILLYLINRAKSMRIVTKNVRFFHPMAAPPTVFGGVGYKKSTILSIVQRICPNIYYPKVNNLPSMATKQRAPPQKCSVGAHSVRPCNPAPPHNPPCGYRIRPYDNHNLARRGQTERDGKALRNACRCLLFLQREPQRLPWRGAVTEGD